MEDPIPAQYQTATLGGGCFWCTEAIFKRLKGVREVTSGFAGGKKENPSWQDVSSGLTGHAESVQIVFDPTQISYEKILDVFWHTHNPTTINQQGYDQGTEYRSVIFYHDQTQKEIALASKKALEDAREFTHPIVTEITPFSNFFPADEYHKNFYESGKRPDYCSIIIDPKIRILLEKYGKEVKEEYKKTDK